MINGDGGWRQVDANERKQFLEDVCMLAAQCARIFAVAFSFENFATAAGGSYGQPFGKSHWNGAALYISALIQQKMQKERKNKGLTVLIFDDNKKEMANLSDSLHEASPWFDPMYQTSRKVRGQTVWNKLTSETRFDQIVNTAFALKSQHSSLVQIADAVAYIYRRNIELVTNQENWVGEKDYIGGLLNKLPRAERLGRNPGGPCLDFYNAARHLEWRL